MSLWTKAEVPTGIENYLAATMWRTATNTVAEWRDAFNALCDTAYEQLPIVTVQRGHWCSECWSIKTSI
eukprot:9187497-Pyramimonas_sp.AAC.1